MLAKLILENFKAFGHRQVIPLAPITLIFGANSAGKSSILQSLLMLKQTLTQPEGDESLLLPNGELVELGGTKEMIHRHDTERICEIALIEKMPSYVGEMAFLNEREWHLGKFVSKPASVGLGIRFSVGQDRALSLLNMPLYWNRVDAPAFHLVPIEDPTWLNFSWDDTDLSDIAHVNYRGFLRAEAPELSHPLWHAMYEMFVANMLGQYRELLNKQLNALDENQHMGSPLWQIGLYPERVAEDSPLDGPDWILALEDEIRAGLKSRLANLPNYDLQTFARDSMSHNWWRPIARRNIFPEIPAILNASQLSREPLVDRWLHPDRYESRENKLELPDLIDVADTTGYWLRGELNRLVYLGPLRQPQDRYYPRSGRLATDVGKSGSLLPHVLLRHATVVDEVNKAFRQFGVGYTLKLHVLDDELGGIFGLRLVDQRTGTTVSVSDVGFGVGQVLPIIVQSMLARQQLILIEQPETHLHPRLQAELGSLFAKCIDGFVGNQFIIETHSEHLILRIQRLIRSGELNPEHVSVVYVVGDEQGSICHPLRLDEEGDFIDEWPEGFFEEGYREMFL